jgi:hypothetical protein
MISVINILIKLPIIIPFNFPNLVNFKGKIGLSIICINGVSFRTVILDNSNCLTNSVKIAPLACISTSFFADGIL